MWYRIISTLQIYQLKINQLNNKYRNIPLSQFMNNDRNCFFISPQGYNFETGNQNNRKKLIKAVLYNIE